MNYENLVKDNIKLIYKVASMFYGAEKEDLVQAGMLGVIKAYKKYKEVNGTKFSTYAYEYIYGEMYLVASKKLIKTNKDILKIYKIVEKTRYEYAQKIGKLPSNKDLSMILDLDVRTIDFACMCASEVMSMDSDSEVRRNMHEVVSSEKVNLDERILLYDGIGNLNEEEKAVIESRYLKDLTQSEVAKNLNMSQVRVSRLEKRSINKLREYMVV